VFKDRKEAGIQLAEKLTDFRGQRNVLVLALPRGGVVTGAEMQTVQFLSTFIGRK
jgi:predicted phosphoribosyltransferase